MPTNLAKHPFSDTDSTVSPPVLTRVAAKPAPSPRVLLVEDYPANVLVATTYLEQFGYDFDVATTGEEAVAMVKKTSYAAVLMDVQMQAMNGLEATRHIRAYEALHGLPRLTVIGMTAHALAGDREMCLGAGMDEYIAKPFNPDDLQRMLKMAVILIK